MKPCTKCGEIKSDDSYGKNGASRRPDCRSCVNAAQRRRNAAFRAERGPLSPYVPPDQSRAKPCTACGIEKAACEFPWHVTNVRRRAKCSDCYAAQRATHRSNNAERIAAKRRAHYEANRDSILARHRKYHREHYAELKAKQDAYRALNPEVWASSAGRRRTRIRTNMDAQDKTMSVEYRKAIANDPCRYCGARADRMHVDHMVPLARGGTEHWWNLTAACASCNLRKNVKTAAEFIGLQGHS